MKVLLIGPYPPPHGGVSVHVALANLALKQAGTLCRVLNIDRRAVESEEYIWIRGRWDLLRTLLRHAREGWILHCHTHGHSLKSWFLALGCGFVGLLGPGALLTLHSGIVPEYLRRGRIGPRFLARLACFLCARVICVNSDIRQSLVSLGVPAGRLLVLPAFLPSSAPAVPVPAFVERWIRLHQPLLAVTLFFRQEYGFELLLEALARLRPRHSGLGCLVMGSGERRKEAQQQLQRRGLEDNILLLGDVPHDLCLTLISLSDLFVRPSFKDGDALSVREALRLGVPVVASDVSTRPPGTLLFQTGNAEDLAAKIEQGLAQPHPAPQPSGSDDMRSLFEIYSRFSSGRGELAQKGAAPTAGWGAESP